MKMRTDFFKMNEREIIFKSVDDLDGWGSSSEELFTVNGLVSFASPSLKPEEMTELGSMNIRLYFNIDKQADIALLDIGDIAIVDGAEFQIKIIDNRGVRPTAYPLRIEGQRL